MDVAADPWADLELGQGRWWDVDDAVYHASPIANRGQLDDLDESPRIHEARWVSEPPTLSRESTAAMRKGRVLHTLVLQPHLFASTYVVEPKWEHRSNSNKGKEEREPFFASVNGREVVSYHEYRLAKAMADKVRANRLVARLLERAHLERAAVFREETTGTLVRIKPDVLDERPFMDYGGVLADLKSTDDPHPREVPKTVANLQYYRQAALYLDGVQAVTGRPHFFLLVMVRSSWPHETAIYPLSEPALAQGRNEYRALLADLTRRRAENDWAAPWELGINLPISLPQWKQERFR